MHDGATVFLSTILPLFLWRESRDAGGGTPPIVPLLVTVFNSITEVVLLCLAGYALAGRGILDKKTQRQLNHLNVFLFTPALLFSKVAFSLTPEKLRELWIIPLFFLLVTAVSMAVAYTFGSMFRLTRSQRNFAMAAAMFMNSNSLPIALMQSLVVTVPGLEWGEDDDKNSMLGRALTYLVLYSTLGLVLRWSYGVRLLSQADEDFVPEAAVDVEDEPIIDHPGPSSSSSSSAIVHTGSYFSPTVLRHTTYYRSFPNSPDHLETRLPDTPPVRSPLSLTPDCEESDSDDDGNASDEPLIRPRLRHLRAVPAAPLPPPSRLHSCARRAFRIWLRISGFMTPPLWASLLSIIVACIQPLQHTIQDHMPPVIGGLKSAGNCSIPLTLVVLGAYFYPSEQQAQKDAPLEAEGESEPERVLVLEPELDPAQASQRPQTRKEPSAEYLTPAASSDTLTRSLRDALKLSAFSRRKEGKKMKERKKKESERQFRMETRTVVISVLSRMLITPALILPFLALAAKFGWHEIFDDPVFVVSCVLLVSSPPALTLAQITQAACGDAFERLIGRTLFWSYCVVTPPAIIFFVVLGLLLARL